MAIPRLRQRVLSPPLRIGPPRWVVESTFDLDFHLRRSARAPADAPALLDSPATDRVMLGFDRARPLWEFTLVEGLEGGRAAFVMKVHHSMTDGVGGMELLTELVDFEREPEPTARRLPAVPGAESFGSVALVRDSLTHTSRRIARHRPPDPRPHASSATIAALRDPAGAPRNVVSTARSVGRLLAPATTPISPVMRDRGLGRGLAMLTSVSTT